MQIRVLFFGMLKEIVGQTEEEIHLEAGSDIARLFDLYVSRFPRLARHSSSILFSRNREFADRHEGLQEGDEVAFLPPVTGGCPAAADRASPAGAADTVERLTRAAIDTRALVRELLQGEDGAAVIFEGVVRNHSGGRATRFLEYEAYEPMALAKMREITAKARQRFRIGRIGIVHRLGRLEIGEASVVIVVTAGHRRPAFEACQYAIDRLKRIVPIWKKEFFADGAVWVEGEPDGSSLAGRARAEYDREDVLEEKKR